MSHNHFCQINNAAPVLAHQSGKYCSEKQYTHKSYYTFRSSQTQAEHPFHAGCYFCTQKHTL
nr:MAG TPA: hypothetical protein [Caudoviricetes sp.]